MIAKNPKRVMHTQSGWMLSISTKKNTPDLFMLFNKKFWDLWRERMYVSEMRKGLMGFNIVKIYIGGAKLNIACVFGKN